MFSSKRFRGVLPLAACALIVAAYALRVALLRRHAFNPDEFQHLHGAWCIAKGLLPYRDYFDHHTPWLHFFLASFLSFFDVETSPASAETFIFFARAWMSVFSGFTLALTFWLGRLWDGTSTAWAGTALLSTTVMFLDKTLEIRPDVPAVAFLLGSWVALMLALQGVDECRRARFLFAESGFLLGVALLCTQKVLFTLPASFLLLAWHLLESRDVAPRADRLRNVLFHVAGVLVPVSLVLAAFAAQDALSAFVHSNLLVNLRWPVRLSSAPLLRQLFHENTLLVVLGAMGWTEATIRLFRDGGPRGGRALVPLQALGLGAGAFVIPVPYAQYFVLLIPLWALLAGSVLLRIVSAAARVRNHRARMLTMAALGVLVVALSIRPVRTMVGILRPPHAKVDDQLDRLRYVLEHTGPQDAIMDGFTGFGVFRPHAYFYFFLHDEIRALLHGREMRRLLAQLRDGTVAPAWLALDHDLRDLPSEIVAFFEENYEATDVLPFWRRKDLWLDDQWLDLGDGPTDVLAGQGWYPPQAEGMRSYRQGRGRRSSLRLPVRNPGSCRQIVVRARLEYAVPAATVQVAVNGASLGLVRLSPGWQNYAVPLPRPLLRSGMNTMELIYHPVPREVEPSYSGRNALAAVDGIMLECAVQRR